MKVLALVLAGGEGTRLHPLTAEHAKPAISFASGLRIVDFVLSNLYNSRILNVYMLAQHRPESLIRHVHAAWKPWFDDRGGFIRVALPRSDTMGGHFKGTADAVYQCLDLVRQHAPEAVAVFAADHVYRMDVRQMVSFHLQRDAEASVAALAVPIENASGLGVIDTDPEGRIREFREKPERPAPLRGDPRRVYASMGIYLFHPGALAEALRAVSRFDDSDLGRDVMPALAGRPRVFAYDFAGNLVPGIQDYEEPSYWRDVGTHEALRAARNDVLGLRPRFNLWNRRWPIRGEQDAALVAKILGLKGRTKLAGTPAETAAFLSAAKAASESRRSA